MRLIFFLICIFISTLLRSQKDTVIYSLDKNFNNCNDSASVFKGTGIKMDSHWQVTLYEKRTNTKVCTAFYKDSIMGIMDGIFESYYSTGNISSRINYVNGKIDGAMQQWSVDGSPTDSVAYNVGKPFAEKNWYYRDNGKLHSIYFKNISTNEKNMVEYDEDGNKLRENHFEGPSGEVREYYPNGNISMYQKWVNNKMIVGQFYQENGAIQNIDSLKNASKLNSNHPQFPGGQGAFQMWIDKLKFPSNVQQSTHFNDEVNISFYLDKNGKAYNISCSDDDLSLYLIQQLSAMPNWQMFGYSKWGPINFTLHMR